MSSQPADPRWRRIIDHWFRKLVAGGLLLTTVVLGALTFRNTQHVNRPKIYPSGNPILTLWEARGWQGSVEWHTRSTLEVSG
jgi:hypothetical protein